MVDVWLPEFVWRVLSAWKLSPRTEVDIEPDDPAATAPELPCVVVSVLPSPGPPAAYVVSFWLPVASVLCPAVLGELATAFDDDSFPVAVELTEQLY